MSGLNKRSPVKTALFTARNFLEGFLPAAARRPRPVSARETLRIIAANNLKPAHGAWHYSWDVERFHRTMLLSETRTGVTVRATGAINEWAPVAAYTSEPESSPLETIKSDPMPYWFLHLGTFDDFLARRSEHSSQPDAHFPTRQTYAAASRKSNCRLEHLPLAGNEALFAALYDRLKNAKYRHSGEDCWRGAINNNPGVPLEWFHVFMLLDASTGVCKAVQIGIQDSRSYSGINAGSERRSGVGYGILLDVEIVRHLCGLGLTSFDCGVSGDYGGYKRKVFMDAIPTRVQPQVDRRAFK